MKLIHCPKCNDFVAIGLERRSCYCGKSWGGYTDRLSATYGGAAIPTGIANSQKALSWSTRLMGYPDKIPVEMFWIDEDCDTFRREKGT